MVVNVVYEKSPDISKNSIQKLCRTAARSWNTNLITINLQIKMGPKGSKIIITCEMERMNKNDSHIATLTVRVIRLVLGLSTTIIIFNPCQLPRNFPNQITIFM